MLDEVVEVFFNGFAGFLFLSCELFDSRGAEFFALGRRDADRAGSGNEGFEFLVIHLGDVFAFEFVEGNVGEKVLEVVGGFHLDGEVEIVNCGVQAGFVGGDFLEGRRAVELRFDFCHELFEKHSENGCDRAVLWEATNEVNEVLLVDIEANLAALFSWEGFVWVLQGGHRTV